MVNKRVHAVFQLKDPTTNITEVMKRLAQFTLDNFGTGGNPLAEQIENYLGWVNTPVYGSYFTSEISIVYGSAFELLKENEDVRLVRIEWSTNKAGESVRYDPILYEVDDVDENGVVTTWQQPIGRIA